MSAAASGVRKGAWTQEEDILLRNCIAKYGEGKWHLIPFRAGLNRCRKSCRLRWLNYLRPDIKRGDFDSDEVDLIIRLHKLLGNRWSLIAGRLPGRTANDVKNYWNTHFLKKMAAINELQEGKAAINKNCGGTTTTPPPATARNVIFKPRPRAFSKNGSWQMRGKASSTTETPRATEKTHVEDSSTPAPNSVQIEKDTSTSTSTMRYWLDNLFLNLETEPAWPYLDVGSSGAEENGGTSLCPGELSNLHQGAEKDGAGDRCNQEGELGSSRFFPIDSDFWDLLL